MSCWNYRVIKRAGEFAIHEAFYDDDGSVVSWTQSPVSPRAGSVEDLAEELERYGEALAKPVIVDPESPSSEGVVGRVEAPGRVETREDLIAFLSALRHDLTTNEARWENPTLESYLEALQAVLTDWQGRFVNRGEPVPEQPTWRLLAELLGAASMYE
jgi:hypothetical protein